MKSQGHKSRVSSYEAMKRKLTALESQIRHKPMTDTVTVSDVGNAVLAYEMELDRLCTEQAELELKLENNKVRQKVCMAAVNSIMVYGVYKCSYVDI